MVEKVVRKVGETGKPEHLKPMSSYDRKLIHDMVSEAGLSSESEGQGRDRHIVIRKL
jgi:spoIIIJ-associated protein